MGVECVPSRAAGASGSRSGARSVRGWKGVGSWPVRGWKGAGPSCPGSTVRDPVSGRTSGRCIPLPKDGRSTPSCGAKAMTRSDTTERRPRLRQQQARAPSRASLAEAICFDEDRFETGNRAGVSRGAPGQAAPDDDNVSREFAAKSWMVWPARTGKGIDPW